jgi:hypothetical protein
MKITQKNATPDQSPGQALPERRFAKTNIILDSGLRRNDELEKEDWRLSFNLIEKIAECFYRLSADDLIFVLYDEQGHTCQADQLSFFSGFIQV